MKTTTVLIGLAGIMATALVAAEVQNYATAATGGQSPVVDAQGSLRVPEDYRAAYQFLGAWAIAADQGKGSHETPCRLRVARHDRRLSQRWAFS